jgi:hypothetical protein
MDINHAFLEADVHHEAPYRKDEKQVEQAEHLHVEKTDEGGVLCHPVEIVLLLFP